MLSLRPRSPAWSGRAASPARRASRARIARRQQRARSRSPRPRPSASSRRTPRSGGRRAPRAPRRTGSTAPRPRPARARASLRPASASDCRVETPTSGMPRAPRQRPRGRDPDPQSRERSRPDADRDSIDVLPADPGAIEHHRGQRQQPRGVAGALARRRDRLAPCRRRCRRPTGPRWSRAWRCRTRGSSSRLDRHHPPVAAGVLDHYARGQAREPRDRRRRRSGHSTNAIRSGPM